MGDLDLLGEVLEFGELVELFLTRQLSRNEDPHVLGFKFNTVHRLNHKAIINVSQFQRTWSSPGSSYPSPY